MVKSYGIGGCRRLETCLLNCLPKAGSLVICHFCLNKKVRADLPHSIPGKAVCSAATAAKLLQSCPTLHYPMDCSLPGSSVHGIFQARVLEWGATAFSAVCSRMPYSPATEEPVCFHCIQLLCASQTVVFGLPVSESPGMPV